MKSFSLCKLMAQPPPLHKRLMILKMDEISRHSDEPDASQTNRTLDCPTLTSVLNDASVGNIQIIYQKNIDNIQEELENLFVHLKRKHNELSQELSSFDKVTSSNEENISVNEEPTTQPVIMEAAENSVSPEECKRISSARVRCKPAKTQDLEFSLKTEIPKQQKNDAPSRFWSSFEPYFSDITNSDIKFLETWIENHQQDSEYQKIPDLGPHYSSVWKESEILEEIGESSKSVENPKGVDPNALSTASVEEMLQLCQCNGESPLIQNLLTSLVEENIIASSDIMTETIPSIEDPSQPTEDSNPEIEDTLQNRLVADLEEIGVLNKTVKEQDDELLQEIKKMQALLIPISNYNLQKKRELLARAKKELAKQESKKRVQELDAKIMESYRAMSAARSKGKKMSKNELYVIRTLLEDREALLKST